MHPISPNARDLSLEFIGDLYRRPFPLRTDLPLSIGRAADSDIVLLSETVSRRHASVSLRSTGAFLTDLGSTHGTYLNSLRIPASKPSPITTGDLIRVGPFTLRVITEASAARHPPTSAVMRDGPTTTFRVHTLASFAPSSGQRLRALIQCIARLDGAGSLIDAVNIALTYAIDGSGYTHAAILRLSADSQVEVVASRRLDDTDGELATSTREFSFSKSLILTASRGQTAVLSSTQLQPTSHSLAGLQIHSALCAPIHVGEVVAGYLYLDARENESPVDRDAGDFCDALATALGLSFANISRADLERRQNALADELSAAHEAQQFILPEPDARMKFLSYGMRMRPGAYVAGDLFDVVELPDGRTAIAIGDVAGHGAGSAMLMASTQANLNAQLVALGDPALALSAVNAYLASKPLAGRFVSLWLGVFSPDGTLEVVDAGHGHWIHIPAEGTTNVFPTFGGSIPLGISAATTFTSVTFHLAPNDRILLFTDGVIEQRDPEGDRLGVDRVRSMVGAARSPAQLVEAIIGHLIRFSGTGTLEDDATVACIEYMPRP